jgi:Ca2+-binding RTX toxin-like protein
VLITGEQADTCPVAVCGTHGTATLDGGEGDDALIASYGRANMTGGGGDDQLLPPPAGEIAGSDLSGGPGRDLVDFSSSSGAVSVSLDDVPDDGPAGAGENAHSDLEDIVGTGGDDVLIGNAGANVLDGGDGDDVMSGGPGADELSGGDGEDVADYTDHRQAVVVRFNGQSDSGGVEDGTGDTVQPDVEDAWGGDGADTLLGNDADNLLNGGPGADVLRGGGGEDAADYSDRSEGVTATPDGTANSGDATDGAPAARDTIATDIEDLYGGSGPDHLAGNAAANFIDAGPGDDVLDTRDQGEDDDVCGTGSDVALVDAFDVHADDCELAQLPSAAAPTGPPPTTPAPSAAAPELAVALQLPRGQRLKTMLQNGLRLRATCTTACALRADALLNARAAHSLGFGSGKHAVRVGTRTARLDRPTTVTLIVKFDRKARKRLARQRTMALTIRVAASHGTSTKAVVRRLQVTRKGVRLLAAASTDASLAQRPSVGPRMTAASQRL